MRLLEVLPIFEIRKFPKLNVKNPIIDELRQYKNMDNVYIHFTDELPYAKRTSEGKTTIPKRSDAPQFKLGVNPDYKWNNPLGIYGYPLKELWNHLDMDNGISSTYGTNKPYVYIFKWKGSGNIIDVNRYSEKDAQRDILKLSKLYNTEYNEADFEPYKVRSNLPFDKTYQFVGYLANHNGKKMTYILKQIGWDGITDIGNEILHKNEPYQSVFFHTKDLIILDKFDNKSYKKRIVTPKPKPNAEIYIGDSFDNKFGGKYKLIMKPLNAIKSELKYDEANHYASILKGDLPTLYDIRQIIEFNKKSGNNIFNFGMLDYFWIQSEKHHKVEDHEALLYSMYDQNHVYVDKTIKQYRDLPIKTITVRRESIDEQW